MSRDSETVSKNMRSIHSKDTSIELQLRKALWHKGYRYRKNYKALPGSPDIVLTKYKIAIFYTLFTLEDLYGLHIDEIDGELCLRLDKSKGTTYLSMFDTFHAWQEQAEKLKSGEITQEEYDQWRYNYPKNAK